MTKRPIHKKIQWQAAPSVRITYHPERLSSLVGCGLLLIGLTLSGCKNAAEPPPITPPGSAYTLDLDTIPIAPLEKPEWLPRYLEQLDDAMEGTRYSALIKEEGVRVRPYTGPGDYYISVEKITAKVLETYRGETLDYIEFDWALEGEGDVTVRPDPYIITLCDNDNGYYRQEILADIPATPETIKAARTLSLSLIKDQQSFEYCYE